jgi:hypothetical protein
MMELSVYWVSTVGVCLAAAFLIQSSIQLRRQRSARLLLEAIRKGQKP